VFDGVSIGPQTSILVVIHPSASTILTITIGTLVKPLGNNKFTEGGTVPEIEVIN
jgi:hypothetical protein